MRRHKDNGTEPTDPTPDDPSPDPAAFPLASSGGGSGSSSAAATISNAAAGDGGGRTRLEAPPGDGVQGPGRPAQDAKRQEVALEDAPLINLTAKHVKHGPWK